MMLILKNNVKFALILTILFALSVSVVSASEDINLNNNLTSDSDYENAESAIDFEDLQLGDKPIPSISVNSTKVNTGESIGISLKDSNNNVLVNKNLTTIINNDKKVISTNDDGVASLKLNLSSNKYILNVIFEGDDEYDEVNETFDITVLKISTNITVEDFSIKHGSYFYSFLTDIDGNPLSDKKITFSVDGKTFSSTTNSKGRAEFKANLPTGIHSLKISFDGDEYYQSISKTITLVILVKTSIEIGNSVLLTNGYLRVYLKSSLQSAVADKNVKITINGKVYNKKTNSEGIIIFKPSQTTGTLSIEAEFDGTSTVAGCEVSKKVTGIKGNPKDPLKSKIPLKNGVPNVDYMTGGYVMADGDMSYTLTKAQYRAVIKRDSYCLYLNKKLSKYTFFKSKAEPKLNHIIKREKWNVIERAINTKIVKKNRNGYWPGQITVSLKGKSYSYPEVRDEQDTGYTCGPTSCSMCSQVLRNYYCEKYLAKHAGTSSLYGSSTKGLKKSLEKFHFKCRIYYKSSFNYALKQLKKGGCALVFHTWGHYVSILDISKDGKKVLVGNPSGDYDHGSHRIPTNWLTVKYMKKRFNDYDTSGLIVKLKYKLSKATKNNINNFYSSMGTKWARQNTNERLPQI